MEITNKFNGIIQYHDGLAVSDYCNMIPLGVSVIDRQGEEYNDEFYDEFVDRSRERVLETFVDSQKNIYIACTDGIRRYVINRNEVIYKGKLEGITIGSQVSFCESATKPSQVFCCTNGAVYFWNTTKIRVWNVPAEFADRAEAFVPVRVPVISGPGALINPSSVAGSKWFPEVNRDNYKLDDPDLCPRITRVTWFDNRLVMVQKDKNTVWLSEVDPSRWLVPSESTNQPAQSLIVRNPSHTGHTDGDAEFINTFAPHYYSSTASSAQLQDAIAFAGQLYFLNDSSIEIWSATGNSLNPIQHNSQNTLYYGGKDPVIIADTMYLICRDTIHNDFIAAIRQNGQIDHVSNIEIERRFKAGAAKLKPLAVRDQSMIVVYTTDEMLTGYSFTPEGAWWRYENRSPSKDYCAWTIYNDKGTVYGVSKLGYLVKITDSHRRYVDNNTIITRYIRGGFLSFIGRKILRAVEVICDTGVYYDIEQLRPQMYLRVSFDRGLSFGPFLYRAFGASGSNNRTMTWRNCGSGNSILLEFGTSNDVRFQIYGIGFELA